MFRKSLMPTLEEPFEDQCRSTSKSIHCFKGGDGRTNEQPGLIAQHTIWLREHNRLAERLVQLNPHWNDDRIFYEARKIVGAQMQHITYNEWLPLVLGERVINVFDLRLKRRGFYYGYNESVNPTAANAFGTAAFRFGHSLIPKKLNRCDRYHTSLHSGKLTYLLSAPFNFPKFKVHFFFKEKFKKIQNLKENVKFSRKSFGLL